MVNIGLIGFSEGNGHPFSFGAIINGYDPLAMKESGWEVIYNYLKIQHPSDFGFNGARVTHVWTQDIEVSKKISKACYIANIVDDYLDLINQVDAVIIARDDYETHFKISKPFLEKKIPVFIDKPLTIYENELNYFEPFIKNGLLMSCAGLGFAEELDALRANINEFGEIKLIKGTVLLDWEKYGIHLLEAIFHIIPFDIKSVEYINSLHGTYILRSNQGYIIEIDTIGKSSKTFNLEFWSETNRYSAELNNNFRAFRRLLYHFVQMIEQKKPQVDPHTTINIINTLIAGIKSRNKNITIELKS